MNKEALYKIAQHATRMIKQAQDAPTVQQQPATTDQNTAQPAPAAPATAPGTTPRQSYWSNYTPGVFNMTTALLHALLGSYIGSKIDGRRGAAIGAGLAGAAGYAGASHALDSMGGYRVTLRRIRENAGA